MAFVFFRFCGLIVDRDAFTALCFMLRATSAIGGAAAETSALTILLEKFPDNVGMVSGVVEICTGGAFSFGPVMGGVLYTVGGFKLPFIVTGGTMIAVIPILALTLGKGAIHIRLQPNYINRDSGIEIPEAWCSRSKNTTTGESYDREEKKENDDKESISRLTVLKIPTVLVLSLCFAVCGLSFCYPDPILGPHLMELGQNPANVGLAFLCWSATYALFAPLVGCIGDKTKCYRTMMIAGFTVILVGHLLVGPAPFLTFLPAKADSMSNDSSANVLVSSIHNSMYYL
ncbi:hypothetical protein pdam_00021880, partial [Pocillopora damicornis]